LETARPGAHHDINVHKQEYRHSGRRLGERLAFYQRPADICIMPGEILDGGLAMRLPVEGLTIGIALVPERMAEG
jgi:hypothetical protein